MTERDYALIRELPRYQLESLAMRAIAEAGRSRRELARSSLFATLITGFAAGALVSAAGFIAGSLLR